MFRIRGADKIGIRKVQRLAQTLELGGVFIHVGLWFFAFLQCFAIDLYPK
jgi:hypothetical protein